MNVGGQAWVELSPPYLTNREADGNEEIKANRVPGIYKEGLHIVEFGVQVFRFTWIGKACAYSIYNLQLAWFPQRAAVTSNKIYNVAISPGVIPRP